MLFLSLYTWRIPSRFLCIQPFTPSPHQPIATYLFRGNYVDNPSGHPLATLVLTQSVAGIENHLKGERHEMKDKFLKFSAKIQTVLMSEEGQDLIEYALVVALIALIGRASCRGRV